MPYDECICMSKREISVLTRRHYTASVASIGSTQEDKWAQQTALCPYRARTDTYATRGHLGNADQFPDAH